MVPAGVQALRSPGLQAGGVRLAFPETQSFGQLSPSAWWTSGHSFPRHRSHQALAKLALRLDLGGCMGVPFTSWERSREGLIGSSLQWGQPPALFLLRVQLGGESPGPHMEVCVASLSFQLMIPNLDIPRL